MKKITPQFKQPYLLDRHVLHGIDAWQEKKNVKCNPKNNILLNNLSDSRIIIYFRPVFFNPHDWINMD